MIAQLGDPDPAVRTRAAKELSSLFDRGSLEMAVEPLLARLETLDNGNAIYNAVAVLCALRSQLPEQQERIDQGLTELRARLEAEPQRWAKTLAQIEACLAAEL